MKRSSKIVVWKDVRNEVLAANKEFADIIDAIDPGENYKFVKATYLYGDLILRDGIAQLPAADGKLYPLTSTNGIQQNIKNLIHYQAIPLFLALKNDTEVFVDAGSRAIPLNLLRQGSLLGTFEFVDNIMHIDSSPKWSATAGARTIVTLPKITDKVGLKRLRVKYNLSSNLSICGLQDHWKLFTALAASPEFNQPWQSEMLFFNKDWFSDKNNSKEWLNFKHYLFRQAWAQAQSSIMDKSAHNLLNWQVAAKAISLEKLKPRPYLLDQVKHILTIAAGKSPAFMAADKSQTTAPISGLQQALLETYLLKEYFPTIMHVSSTDDIFKNQAVYYSMSFPTSTESSIINARNSTLITDLREIKYALDTIQDYVKVSKNYNNISATMHDFFAMLNLDYFHVEKDKENEVKLSSLIPDEDSAFKFSRKIFCSTSQFWRGCLRIRRN